MNSIEIVTDNGRLMKFEGEVLGHSSSKRADAPRWIEFTLYKTRGGTYILHRVGVSLVYHASICDSVSRYGLKECLNIELDDQAVPCELCSPSEVDPYVYPEEIRSWVMTSGSPRGVVDSLYRVDERKNKYLTKVASTLLDRASENDEEIENAYKYEYID